MIEFAESNSCAGCVNHREEQECLCDCTRSPRMRDEYKSMDLIKDIAKPKRPNRAGLEYVHDLFGQIKEEKNNG